MKLAYVVNVPSFLVSHRLPLAVAAKAQGFDVHVIAGLAPLQVQQPALNALRQAGLSCHAAGFKAAGVNPLQELLGLARVIRHVWRLKPDVVHTVSPKGNLYGGIAARLCRVPKLVVAVSGQGFLFTGRSTGLKKILGRMYMQLIRWVYAHPQCTVIVQNADDWHGLLQAGLLKENQLLHIPGSGVDLQHYAPSALPAQPVVLLPARMLTDKGVLEFVAAARQLKARNGDWRFVLAGSADGPNPAAISSGQIAQWVQEGIVEWWGQQADMPAVFAKAAIVCLPSYREGMPKALLEAAAAGKPVVTTDAVGCREAIEPGVSGSLVPVGDVPALVRALAELIADPDLRARYGHAGRERAERLFSIESVVQRHMAVYLSQR